MDPTMFWTMIIMVFAFWAYAIGVALMRVRCEILEREKNSSWVAELLGGSTQDSFDKNETKSDEMKKKSAPEGSA